MRVKILFAFAVMGLSGVSYGQAPSAATGIQMRAVLHDPVNPMKDFFIPTDAGAMTKVELAVEGLTTSQRVQLLDGTLNLYGSSVLDPSNPKSNLAATVKVPVGLTRFIALIVPSNPGATPPYRMLVLDDSPKAFPWTESRVINITPVDFAIEVGEHKVLAPGAKISSIGPVTKVNEYSQAQASFYFKQDERWVISAERQMQFLKDMRRIFIIYKTPMALSPDVRTITDHAPTVIPVSR
jgi:hypothetical protein